MNLVIEIYTLVTHLDLISWTTVVCALLIAHTTFVFLVTLFTVLQAERILVHTVARLSLDLGRQTVLSVRRVALRAVFQALGVVKEHAARVDALLSFVAIENVVLFALLYLVLRLIFVYDVVVDELLAHIV